MANNDSLKSVENIVRLPSARRATQMLALPTPRAQPAQPVLFASWVAARDQAAAALLGGAKRLLLTGPAGTGKTVLVEHVARVLRAAGRTVIIQLADADPAPPGPGVTLFVDEADRLSAAKLRQLLEETAGTLVLTGLAPLTRRVTAGTVQVTLEPLGQVEAQDYIAQWLALNGRTPAELESRAVRALVELSGGVPRLLSTLLAAGSWLSKSSDAHMIEAVHIQEAAELRSVLGPPAAPAISIVERPPLRQHRVLWSALLASVAVVGAGAAVLPRLFPAETEQAVALAAPLIQRAERWLRAEPSAPLPPRVQSAIQPPAQTPAPAPIQAAPEPVAAPPPAEPTPTIEQPAAPEPPKPTAELPIAPPPVPEPVPAPVQTTPEPVQAAPEPPASVARPETKSPEIKPVEVAPHEVVAPLPSTPPIVAPSPTLPVETLEFLIRRGREMLALDDISAARLLFLRAAEGGSADAMFELGQTYDPAFLSKLGAVQLVDRAEALRWYGRAAAKGNRAAERLVPRP